MTEAVGRVDIESGEAMLRVRRVWLGWVTRIASTSSLTEILAVLDHYGLELLNALGVFNFAGVDVTV